MNEFGTAAAEKAAYAEYWAENARSFASQGCYDWMAAQLDELQPKRLLDIGCGTGEGLLSLSRRFHGEIVAVDENLACLRTAYRLLRANHIAADLRARFRYRQNPDGTHSTIVGQTPVRTSERVSLIQADPLFADPAFTEYLQTEPKFDAVTVWLIGVFLCRSSCADLAPLSIASPEEYRLRVQNRVYALASAMLRPGGWLQVVDRGEPLDTQELVEDSLSAHREQARLGTLRVRGLTSRIYHEHATQKGVEMVISPGTSGRVPILDQTAMVSVISVNPVEHDAVA